MFVELPDDIVREGRIHSPARPWSSVRMDRRRPRVLELLSDLRDRRMHGSLQHFRDRPYAARCAAGRRNDRHVSLRDGDAVRSVRVDLTDGTSVLSKLSGNWYDATLPPWVTDPTGVAAVVVTYADGSTKTFTA
jgi:hypothetical protein